MHHILCHLTETCSCKRRIVAEQNTQFDLQLAGAPAIYTQHMDSPALCCDISRSWRAQAAAPFVSFDAEAS